MDPFFAFTLIGTRVAISLLSSRVPSLPSSMARGSIGIKVIAALALFLSYRKEEWLYFYGNWRAYLRVLMST